MLGFIIKQIKAWVITKIKGHIDMHAFILYSLS